jgi:hypothetical protein
LVSLYWYTVMHSQQNIKIAISDLLFIIVQLFNAV